jgi:hypothetical protein
LTIPVISPKTPEAHWIAGLRSGFACGIPLVDGDLDQPRASFYEEEAAGYSF